MSLTVERLRQHCSQHAVPHQRVYYFHAHTYFQPADSPIAHHFHDKVLSAWKGDDRILVHDVIEEAVSVHPLPNFRTLFNRDVYTDFLTWLQFERPQQLSILIHPLTPQVVADHTARAVWLGPQPPGPHGGVKLEPLIQAESRAAKEGWSEEDYAERTKLLP